MTNSMRVWFKKFNDDLKYIEVPSVCKLELDSERVLLITHENTLYARISNVSDITTVPIKRMNWLQRLWKGYE